MAAVVLLTGVAVSVARCGREKEINAQAMAAKEEQIRQELRMQQEYGCDIYGQYEYPYNTMSQDWSGDQVEGFYYHEITEMFGITDGGQPIFCIEVSNESDLDEKEIAAAVQDEREAEQE